MKTHARAELQDVIEAAQCRYDIVTAAVAAAADRNRAMSDGGAASFVRFLIPPVATAAVAAAAFSFIQLRVPSTVYRLQAPMHRPSNADRLIWRFSPPPGGRIYK